MGIQDRDWYWDHREAVERSKYWPKTFRRGNARLPLIWQIAIGVLAGSLIAGSVGEYFKQRRTEQALEEFQRSMAKVQEEAARKSRLAVERERERQRQIDLQEARRIANLRALQQSQEAARGQRDAEASRRERAWANFYKASERCKVEASVECANEFIRAKRSFEAKYGTGSP